MNETIQFEQVTIDKINDCVSKSKAGAEMQAYTEAGGKLREACELFSTMILNAFLGESATANRSNLDEKLKMLRERKCLLKKETDILYAIKEYGNNTVHSDKNENFNVEEINILIPSFYDLLQDYVDNANSKYENFLERAESGETEAFKKMDRYITKTLQLYTDNWFKNYDGYKSGEKRRVFKIELSKDEISDNDKIEIKKNLYLATKEYMSLLCRISQINGIGDDYGRLQSELSRYNTNNYKAGVLKDYNACFGYPYELKCECDVLGTYYNNEIVYWNDATIVVKDSYSDSYVLRKKYTINTYRLPAEVSNLYENNTTIFYAKERTKNGNAFESDKVTSRQVMKSVDDFIFTKIRVMCEGSLSGEIAWYCDIYDYARMIHQAIEKTKAKFGSKYLPNPLSDIFSMTDACIINEENLAYSETIEKIEELKRNLEKEKEIENVKKERENVIKNWQEEMSSIKRHYKFNIGKVKELKKKQIIYYMLFFLSIAFLILCFLEFKNEKDLFWSFVLMILLFTLLLICPFLAIDIVKINKEYEKAIQNENKLKKEYNAKKRLKIKK